MKYTAQQRLTRELVAEIIKKGWDLEASRDCEGALLNFAPIWPDHSLQPDFSNFDQDIQAALYRLSGFFLSYFGERFGLKDYQERAKDTISRSISTFQNIGDRYGAADALNVLAVCYTTDGSFLEAQTILEDLAKEFDRDRLSPVYLRNRVNFLQIKHRLREFSAALDVINEIEIPLEFSDDFRTIALFHEKAGVIFRGLGQYDRAVFHYKESIRFALMISNFYFVSAEYNNLAFLYNNLGKIEEAHTHINQSLKIAYEHGFLGLIPVYRDTQALIFASESRLEEALEIIDEVVEAHSRTDNYYALTESIWNKCKFLLQLDRKEEAIELFSEMIPIAARQMGEFAVKNFSKEFAEMIYVRGGSDLNEEVRKFKRTEILNALRHCKYRIDDTAEFLKMSVAALSKMLDREFPELRVELDLQLKPAASNNFPGVEKAKPESVPKDISELKLNNVTIELEGEVSTDFRYFYVSAKLLIGDQFPARDVVVAVETTERVVAKEFVIAFDEVRRSLHFGQTSYDVDLNLFFVTESDDKTPLLLNDLKLIGRVSGYLPFEDLSSDRLNFRRVSS